MYLVKVGDRVINLERIAEVHRGENNVVLWGSGEELVAELRDEEARVFWEHVCRCAADLDIRGEAHDR